MLISLKRIVSRSTAIALTICFGFSAALSIAQTTVQIGSSTSNSGVVPIRTDLDYSYTQQIYTATEMASAGVTGQVSITKLRYYLVNNSTTNSNNWTIYMGNTTRTEFSNSSDWEPIANLSTNYSGTVTPPASGNWMEIVLDIPFEWNGIDNIIIAIDQNQAGSSVSNSDWQVSLKGDNRSIYYFSGLTDADPMSPPTASGIFDKVNNIQFDVSPIIAQTNPGNALNFDGNNGYCSTTLPTLFNNIGSNDFTIEAWVKPDVSTISRRVFFAQNNINNLCTILLNPNNIPYFFIVENGISYSVNTQIQLPLSVWSHLAVTWDASSNTIEFYINGVEMSGVSGGSSSIGTDATMTIGARTDGAQIFNGSMDEFRIWDDIRTPCEIYGSMNSEFTSAQTNLIVSYSFNHGIAEGLNPSETTLSELNNDYNATLNNFTLNGSTSNWIESNAPITVSNNNSETHYLNDIVTACESYVWSDNNTYTSSNNSAIHTYTNTSGCTVVENLDLTINLPSTGIDNVSACDTYTWIDNLTYTSSNNTATHTIIGGSSNGCDSIVTLNLTINTSTATMDLQTACDSFTWINGVTYTASNNTAVDTLTTALGCDSVVTLNLTINTVDVSVSNNSTLLTANNGNANYQWIDCATNTDILGENNASFTATSNGSYAVIITENACTDTSACYTINDVGINDLTNSYLSIYPNPSSGVFYIDFDEINPTTELKIVDILGKEIMTCIPPTKTMKIELDVQSGSYFIFYGGSVYQLVIH